MPLRDTQSALLAALRDALTPAGFRERKATRSFEREVGPVRQILHVTFINHGNEFDLMADVGVRHHAVEDVRNARRPNLSPAEKRVTATVGAQLGNIAGDHQHRWTVRTLADVPEVTRAVLDRLSAVGLPFLERYSDLGEVCAALTERGAAARLICPIAEWQAEILDAARELGSQRAT